MKAINPATNLAVDTKGVDDLRRAARENSPEALKATAKQFEALFVNMMMKSMRDASPKDSVFDNEQSRMYTSMLDQQLSQNLASRGLGLAEVLTRQLSTTVNPQAVPTDTPTSAPSVSSSDSSVKKANPWQASALPPAAAAATAAVADTAKAKSSQPAHVRAFQDRLGAHAEEASRATGIPAKFMLGQAALESGWGKREIRAADGTATHNLFGIKATGGWKGKVVDVATTEYVNGVPHKRIEKFRAYDSYADAFRDYANLLRKNPRYENVLANASDAQSFAQGLQRAGYATDPNYAAKLTDIIKKNLMA